ncbi:MAG: hypothetical protein AAGD38_08390 [Acidobacteriota bacterium]
MTQTRTARKRTAVRTVSIALISLLALQTSAAFARPGAGKKRVERRVEVRQTQERRDLRDDRRDERREDRQDHRDDRRDDRQDVREERREDRQDFREDRREDWWRYERWERWEDWVDFRRTVRTARLVAGMIFAALPPTYTVVVIDGEVYYVHEDVHFIEVVRDGVVCYEVVEL